MMKRFLSAMTLLTVSATLTGCGADREMTQTVLQLEQDTKTQFRLLQQQNEFMNRKVNVLNEKIVEAADLSRELAEDLATFRDRPDEVKLEIMSGLNTRFASIVNELDDYKENLDASVNTRIENLNMRVDTKFTETDELLTYHTNFVNFVASEQDSINRLFATRIDARPWYESIIGKWEDRERAESANP